MLKGRRQPVRISSIVPSCQEERQKGQTWCRRKAMKVVSLVYYPLVRSNLLDVLFLIDYNQRMIEPQSLPHLSLAIVNISSVLGKREYNTETRSLIVQVPPDLELDL